MSLPIQEGLIVLFRVLCAVGLGLVVRQRRRVLQVEVVVQPEVDEAEHGGVELDEDGHEAEVHALGRVVGELVWHHPRDGLPHDLGLVVVALDADEDLAQRPSLDEIIN